MSYQEPRQEFRAIKRPPASPGLRGVAVIAEDENAQQALERASLLNLAPEARITVLMKHEESRSGPVGDKLGPMGERLAARLQQQGGHLSVLSLSAKEDTTEEVEQYCQRHPPELVIIARQHKRRLASLFGATPEKLTSHGQVPLLIVQRPVAHPYQRVMVGVEGSPVCHEALALALRMKAPGSGPVDVVHCYDSGYSLVMRATGASSTQLVVYYEEQHAKAEVSLRAFLKPHLDSGADVRLMVRSGDPRVELEEATREQNTELLVVGKHLKPGLGPTLLGSVAEASVRRVGCDVLVVPRTGSIPH